MTTGAPGRSLELYFINGRPDGMLTAEVFNWTGHVLMTPRTQITAALARKEAKHTGIYLLLGQDEDGEPLAYIGESENISDRIKTHDAKKEWWTDAVLVTTSANNLHKAHVKYLEAALIQQAQSIGRMKLANGTAPPKPGPSEAARSNMEAFLDSLYMVLPALRIDMFIENAKPNGPVHAPAGTAATPAFELITKKHGVRATATLVDGEFIVNAGSHARLAWEGKGTGGSGYATLHKELRTTGILQPEGDRCVFVKSYAFRSLSAAAAVVNGRPANGQKEWKIAATGKTYKEWEAAQLEASVEEPA